MRSSRAKIAILPSSTESFAKASSNSGWGFCMLRTPQPHPVSNGAVRLCPSRKKCRIKKGRAPRTVVHCALGDLGAQAGTRVRRVICPLRIPFAVSGHTYSPRRASSASSASWSNTRTSSGLFSGFWPRKSPSLTKLITAAWAPPSLVEVGRMIATGPNFGFRK